MTGVDIPMSRSLKNRQSDKTYVSFGKKLKCHFKCDLRE